MTRMSSSDRSDSRDSDGDVSPTVSLTLIKSSDWNKNGHVLSAARRNVRAIEDGGRLFACNERYGGNTLNREFKDTYLKHSEFRICFTIYSNW